MARNNAKASTPSETKPVAPPVAAKPTPVPAARPAANTVTQAAAPARNTPATLTHEQIASRAYEIFLARGGQHGHAEQDWAQAERELRLGR